MATICELVRRKAKADALSETDRQRYSVQYEELVNEMQTQCIDLAFLCNEYAVAFRDDCEAVDVLCEIAGRMRRATD